MKFIVFQQVAHEHPGFLAKCAKENNVELQVVEFWKPYAMPAVDGADGLIIMGGPMGVYEDFPSKTDELVFIKKVLGRIPILGICLGSQLLAHALGMQAAIS